MNGSGARETYLGRAGDRCAVAGVRRAPSGGAFRWFLVAAVLGAPLLSGDAAAEDFAVDLAPAETTAIGWFDVRAGEQVSWETVNGTGYVNWWVEARPHGEMAGGDGGMTAGCARTAEDIQVRIRLENTAPYNVREAHFVVRVLVAADTGACPAAPDLARERQAFLATRGGLFGDPEFLFRLAVAAAAGTTVIVVAASLMASRRRAREEEPPETTRPPR